MNITFPSVRSKSPTTEQQRLLVLFLDGKKRKEAIEKKQQEKHIQETTGLVFKPQLN
jgi:hypothetical protein